MVKPFSWIKERSPSISSFFFASSSFFLSAFNSFKSCSVSAIFLMFSSKHSAIANGFSHPFFIGLVIIVCHLPYQNRRKSRLLLTCHPLDGIYKTKVECPIFQHSTKSYHRRILFTDFSSYPRF